MGDREHSPASPTAINLSGSLGQSLFHHAMERCRHFFLYLFFYKSLSDRLNARRDTALKPAEGVSRPATHQVDSGHRSYDGAYWGFDPKDPKMVDKSATACGRTDAAHYCNLGIEAKFRARVAELAKPEVDQVAFDLYEALKLICGNTKWLPQRINIGPDRVIDELHGDLAFEMLDGSPPISAENLRTYLTRAKKALGDYRDGQAKKGSKGVAACTEAYIRFYDDQKAVDDMWTVITGNVSSECYALGLTLGDYLKRG